ncbi:hypothetical protein SOCE26_100780 [Sorangium cellulosum]|uniref:Uncharacterized protein n=1 Tax=Sorangium cellulosum TaxID=56 RepID=A0A2L0FAD7_SORCE|nr:hypothetical protein [Sorangium cellulosum]AUX48540.1 hypothetical protein SOCE26_100780 [Sorangium cellulosum]
MPLKLRVTWRNAGSPLLPDALADVQATADDAPLAPAGAGPGLREFAIPEGAARVALKARFSAAFEAFEDVPALQEEVLSVEQAFDVDGGGAALRPAEDPAYGQAHPLVDVKAAPGSPGVVVAQIHTDFVDITPFWMAYARSTDEYQQGHRAGAELVALGATAGEPKIWFANVPEACKAPPDAGVSALVFFRPEGYAYTKVDQRHEMFGLNRYLLTPDPDPGASFWARDVFEVDPRDQSRWVYLRCSFEEALAASGKAVVMLHPWPNGSSFGAAATASLPGLAEAAIRFLWGAQKLGVGRGGVHLGKLGLAGFSAGGLPLWQALAANAGRVSEVFAFDARGAAKNEATILRWYRGDASRRLRLTGGHQLDANAAIRKSLGGSAVDARFSALPPDKSGYLPGANPLWDHVCSALADDEREAHLSSDSIWHQFAVFGGAPRPGEERAVTFLQRFLEESEL